MKIRNSSFPENLFLIFIISLGFSAFYIDSFFAIKPYMFIVLLMAIYIIAKKDFSIYKFISFEKSLLIFVCICALTFFQFRFPGAVVRYIGGLLFIFLVYLIVKKFSCYLKLDQIENAISKGGIVICLTSIIYYIMGLFAFGFNFHCNGIQRYGVVCDRTIPRLITLFNSDPNISSLLMSFLFFFYLSRFNKKSGKIGTFLTGFMILMTFSRGAYLGVAAGLIVYIFFDKSKTLIKKIVSSMVIFAFLILLEYVINLRFNISIFNTISSRFQSIGTDNGSGRIELWTNAIKTFLDHPFFGIGINSTIDYALPLYGQNHYIHNVYLEVLSETGFVGFLFYLSFLSLSLKTAYTIYKRNKKDIYLFITLVSFLTQMMFISVLLSEIVYFVLALIFRYYTDNYIGERNRSL